MQANFISVRYFIPLTLFLILLAFLWNGLHLDPRQLPSTLLNKPLPPFAITTVEDPKIKLSNQDFVGQVSLLNVWATWCLTCHAEHTFLMDLARSQHIPIYGLAYKDDLHQSAQWLKDYGNPYRKVGFDDTGRVSMDLGVYGTPETFVIDKQGVVRYKFIGELTNKVWREKLMPLIAQLQK